MSASEQHAHANGRVRMGPRRRRLRAIVLAGVISAVWLASFGVHLWYGDGENWQIVMYDGSIVACWGPPPGWPYRIEHSRGFDCEFVPPWQFISTSGTPLLPYKKTVGNWHSIAAPLWPLALLAWAYCIWIRRRTRVYDSGYCSVCGYNLTGNQSGVCPECGESVRRQP